MEAKTDYHIVRTIKEVKKVIKYCQQMKVASIDFETSGHSLSSELFYPTIVSVSFQPGFGYSIPLAHFDSPFKDNWKEVLKLVARGLWCNPKVDKFAWNAKFEWMIFRIYGYTARGYLSDGMLAKYLLDEERPHGLKPTTARFIPEWEDYEENYEGSNLPWDEKPLEGLSQYGCMDTDATLRLCIRFEDKLKSTGLYKVYRNLMLPVSPVLGKAELDGAVIDVPYLDDLIIEYKKIIEEHTSALSEHKIVKRFEKQRAKERKRALIRGLKEEIQEAEAEAVGQWEKKISNRETQISNIIAGNYTNKKQRTIEEPVNFSSPTQLIDLFFRSTHGFGFKVIKFTTDKKKQPTDRPSTDEEVLLQLQKKDDSGFIGHLLKVRSLSKLYSTYMVGIRDKVIDGKVHGRFNQHTTVTGRLSSNDPNMQNIPRDTTASVIKTMFVPPPGHLIMQVDYSQAELRVLAAAAKEESMLHAFNSGHDIHLATACKKKGWDYDEKKAILDSEDGSEEYIEVKVERKYAKTINFGIVYQQGAPALAESLEISVDKAKQFMAEFYQTYPKIKKYIDKMHRYLEKQGYVKSVFGRKRRLPNIWSPEWGKVGKAKRDAINAPIQGAASDLTQLSNLFIDRAMTIGLLPYSSMFATVHDSLIYYIKPEHIHQSVPVIKEICRNPNTKEWFGFEINSVEMKVDFEIGAPWNNLKTYKEDTDYKEVLENYYTN